METSGKVRRAFERRGFDVYSCDLLPSDDSSNRHIIADVFDVLADGPWHLLIVHPPCTYLCGSGLHWNKRRPGRSELTEVSLEQVRRLLAADVPHVALENPVGCISTRIRKPDQIIQPYQFGHDASKKTCLWLKGLPKLQGTSYVPPRRVGSRQVWGNQTPSGQNKLGPSPDRWKLRAETYEGIAEAMAEQWSFVCR